MLESRSTGAVTAVVTRAAGGERRALLVAPTYDGVLLKLVPGARNFLDDAEKVLAEEGDYSVRRLDGNVDEPGIRSGVRDVFHTSGDVFIYFYGHGIARPPGLTILGRSAARTDDEGYPLSELLLQAETSKARSVVLVIDCCHAGGVAPPTGEGLRQEATRFLSSPGRAFIASSAADEESYADKELSAFTRLCLSGLRGEGALPGEGLVTARSLFDFVAAELGRWDQDPVLLAYETGQHGCHLTRREVRREPPATPALNKVRLGIPFDPAVEFVGREAELDTLRAYLLGTDRPVSVSASLEGLGGVGKTELVVQLLNDEEVDAAFASVLWFDASAPLAPQWDYFANKLSLPEEGRPDVDLGEWVVRSLAPRGRTLLILDNADRWQDIKGDVPKGVSVIVTTRSVRFGDSSFVHEELGTLSRDAAVHLLTRLIPAGDVTVLGKLADRLGGHALALEIAGHHIRESGTPDEYLARFDALAEGDPVTAAAADRTHYGRTVERCLGISWNALTTEAARRLWVCASLFAPASAHRDLLAAVSDLKNLRAVELFDLDAEWLMESTRRLLDQNEFPAAYDELRRAHVLGRVEGYNGERWTMHRLVRDFGRRRISAADVLVHAAALSLWLRRPTLPVEPEAPHVVAAILDISRFDVPGSRDVYRSRLFHRARRSSRGLLSETLLRHIEHVGQPSALSVIFEGLADANEDVRVEAVAMLNELRPSTSLVAALADVLDDPSPTVRQRTAMAIVSSDSLSAMDLLDQAGAMSERATESVIEVLAYMRGRDEVLQRACERLSGTAQLSAAIYLTGRDPVARDVLVRAVPFADASLLEEILTALAPIEEMEEDLRDALGALADGDDRSRAYRAAVTLAEAGSASHLDPLLRPPDDSSYQLDRRAVLSLAKVAPQLLPQHPGIRYAPVVREALESLPTGRLRKLQRAWEFGGLGELAAAAERELLGRKERASVDPASEAGRTRAAARAAEISLARIHRSAWSCEVMAVVGGGCGGLARLRRLMGGRAGWWSLRSEHWWVSAGSGGRGRVGRAVGWRSLAAWGQATVGSARMRLRALM